MKAGITDVGFLGSDKFADLWGEPRLEANQVGEVEGCDFVLAARPEMVEGVEARLENGDRLRAVTSSMQWLANIAVTNSWNLWIRGVSGSVEAYRDMANMIADLRVTGATLRDNGLQEFRVLESVKLGLIYRSDVADIMTSSEGWKASEDVGYKNVSYRKL